MEKHLKVGVVFPPDPWVSQHLTGAWRAMGAEVEEIIYPPLHEDWSTGREERFRQFNTELKAKLLVGHRDRPYDLVFCMVTDDVVAPETLQDLRRAEMRLVNYCVDAVHMWYRLTRTGRFFDLVACAQISRKTQLERHRVRFHHLPMAYAPHLFSQQEPLPVAKNTVLYLGSPWWHRVDAIAALEAAELPVTVLGHNWGSNHQPPVNGGSRYRKLAHDLSYYFWRRLRGDGLERLRWIMAGREWEKKARVRLNGHRAGIQEYEYAALPQLCQTHSLNLAFSHIQGIPFTPQSEGQMRLRDFEVMGNGGLLLAQDSEELRAMPELRQQTLVWEALGQLIEQARWALSHPDELVEKRKLGRQMILSQNCWEHRFMNLMKELAVL